MSGIKKAASTWLDPANFFGKRPGGVNWANAIDPQGYFVKQATGSDIGRKITDPLTLYSTGKVEGTPETILTYDEKRKQQQEKNKVLADLQARRRAAAKTILSTTDEHF